MGFREERKTKGERMNILTMILFPTYMISFLYAFVFYNNQMPKTPIYYLWQTLLIGMILIPTLILSEIITVLAKRQ